MLDKITVSLQDVEAVPDTPLAPVEVAAPGPAPAARRRAPIGWVARVLMAVLALCLPVLCVASLIVNVLTRRRDPRVRTAWLQYCCTLLAISGLLGTGVALFTVFTLHPDPGLLSPQAGPFALDSQPDLSATASSALLTPSELASRVEKSVFIVAQESHSTVPRREDLQYSGFGTGVLIFADDNNYLIATSRHVLDGEKWETSRPTAAGAVLWDREGGSTPAQVVGRHRRLDLMLLEAKRPAGGSRFAQPILDFDKIALGEHIMIFGHPEGLFFSLADGLVSRKIPAGQLQITAPVSPGASGGPVFDLHGRLLGIVCSMLDKRRNPHSENLNFAVRADRFLFPDEWTLEPQASATVKEFVKAARAAAENGSANPSGTAPRATPTPAAPRFPQASIPAAAPGHSAPLPSR